jgi:cell wall-associated NlpC family hydrolase
MSDVFIPRPITGEEVVAEARRWLGTPYKQAGATREGVCCAGLPFGVGQALAQIPADARLPAHNPLTPSPRVVLQAVGEYSCPVPLADAQPGDVIVMSIGERPLGQHLAILSNVGLIQLFPARSICRVSEHHVDTLWAARMLSAHRYKGVIA